MSRNTANIMKETPGDQVKVGSVIIPIHHAPVTLRLKPAAAGPATAPQTKTYESYVIPHCEGPVRLVRRCNTLAKARACAKEVAKDGQSP